MSATINIVETTTELGVEVVEVTVTDASAPGPAGPGVPTGGTAGQVLTKDSGTDYDTSWQDSAGGGGGAPTDAGYLVTAAHAGLSAEVAVGATPGGELGGTWAAPTVDATHSGSSHASVQAAAEATAQAALDAHLNDTTDAHDGTAISFPPSGPILSTDVTNAIVEVANLAILDALLTTKGDIVGRDASFPVRVPVGANDLLLVADSAQTTGVKYGQAQTASIADGAVTAAKVAADVATQAELDDHSARHENGGADEISLAGLDGTPNALQTHLDDTSDAHDASAISVADVAGDYTATDVEGVLAEIAPQLGGGTPSALQLAVAQTAHGLSVGDVVRLSGTSYTKAQANNETNAEVVGIVAAVADVNNFTLHFGGRITGLSGLTAGTVYYIDDDTAGLLTSTEPTDSGDVSKPVLVADTTTSGFWVNYRGLIQP